MLGPKNPAAAAAAGFFAPENTARIAGCIESELSRPGEEANAGPFGENESLHRRMLELGLEKDQNDEWLEKQKKKM